jgi:hypothetical protein
MRNLLRPPEYIKRQHPDMPIRGVHVYHTEFHALDGDGPFSLELLLLWFRVGHTSMLQQGSGHGSHCRVDTLAGVSMGCLPQCPWGLLLMAQYNPLTGFI